MSAAHDIPRRRPLLRAALPAAGLLPLVLWQIVFFVVPVALIFGVSVWRTQSYRLIPAFTFDNYIAIFARPAIWRALLLSVETAAFVTVACAVLAFPVAYFIAKKAGRWRGLLLVAVIAPFWISIVMRVAAWRLLLGERGVINQVAMTLGLTDAPMSFLLYSPVSTAIGLIYAYLPLYVLPLYAAISNIHDNWIEAALDLNASPARTFFEVILPLSAPGLVVGAVFCFVFGLGEFVTPALLGGGKQLMFSQVIQDEFQRRLDWPSGAAMAVVLLVLVFAALALSMKWIRRASGETGL
ncbi:ABC transporter permease [Ancylobacter polymorphus]|uniref:ABC-type spermidine/putrescine transport system permease subunit I n=1 Tax=Ancylobacter polymorphus TaxID=223390 RepID=A0ABU0B8S9_9HYPH|nr:ABC transporter permease [Ancylobacter polymorphus]MDQ0301432.1 ABC-type spermidine/putrescine transport system permease subunit I [Ancylobacter polymorphus]